MDDKGSVRLILITGARGFIGSHLMEDFPKLGFEVAGTDRIPGDGVLTADITDLHQIDSVVAQVKPEAVIHLAAICGTSGTNEVEQSM